MGNKSRQPNIPVATLLTAAQQARSRGSLAEAEALCQRVLAQQPYNTAALVLLSDVATLTNRTLYTQELLRTAIRYDPNCVDALVRLAQVLRTNGGQQEGVQYCLRAIEAAPEDANAYFVLGISYIDLFQLTEAIAALEKSIGLRPEYGGAYDRLGYALQVDGRYEEAIAAYQKAIELSPDFPNSYVDLGNLFARQGAAAEAEAQYDRAVQACSNSINKLMAIAKAHRESDNIERAIEALRLAIKFEPKAGPPRLLLGQILKERGDFEEASQIFKDTLAIYPAHTLLYNEIVACGKFTKDDVPLIGAMKELLQVSTLPPEDYVRLHYALGKAYDDLREYGDAMTHFHEANRIAYGLPLGVFRDRKTHSALIDHMIATYTEEFMAELKSYGSQTEEPIFVFGMPRSGSTLTEQILSSHPDIGAAGERTYWSAITYPNWKPRAEDIPDLAADYLRRMRPMSHGEARITDKMLTNYLIAGLIHIVFPNARMIHCRRNAIDTCFSIYTTPIKVSFSYSLADIAFSFREYERIMEVWRRVLPPNRFMELDYEELIANPDPVSRRLIDFVGLPWNDAVGRRDGKSNAIQTMSLWQARQPLYTGSVERWRRYEPWIGELLDEFPELAVDRAEAK